MTPVPGKHDGNAGRWTSGWREHTPQHIHGTSVPAPIAGFDAARVVVLALSALVALTLGGAFQRPSQPEPTLAFRPIEQIEAGDQVWAYDIVRDSWQAQEVLRPIALPFEGDLVVITAACETIEATGDHPFWVTSGDSLASRPRPSHLPDAEPAAYPGRGRWVDARDLRVGDAFLTHTGEPARVDDLAAKPTETTVHNLDVAGPDTYVVGLSGVLVHNRNPNGSGHGAGPAPKVVPNPGGRLGNAATRTKIKEVVQDLRSRGFTQVRQEVRFRPGSLGSGKNRYADVVGCDPITGKTEIIQIGRTLKSDPRVPVIRERHALDDIIFSPDIQNFPDTTIRFVDVNRPGVIQP